MFGLLLSLIDPVSRIVGKIADARVELARAQTDKDKIAAEERISALEARRDVMIAESGSRVNPWMRAGFALPFVIYNFKLVVWDKVFALGSTDPLSAELYQTQLAVIGFYFLYAVVDRVKRR